MHNGTTYRRMLAMMGWSQKMSLAGLLLFLITVASIGNLNKSFAEQNRGKHLTSAMVGLFGAILGFWLAHHFGSHFSFGTNQANFSPILWAVVTSVLLSLLMTLISRSGRFFLKLFKSSTVTDPARRNLSHSKS